MPLHFTKMHGLGNDFIVIDATQMPVNLTATDIQKMADRKTGIGFDQLLILAPPPSQEYDFTYRIYNGDGREVEQCGNGARCVGHYIFTQKLLQKEEVSLATQSGKIDLRRETNGYITVNMGTPKFIPQDIPFLVAEQQSQYELDIDGQTVKLGAVSLGNPHAVIVVKNVLQAPVEQIGHALQHHAAFPNQVNVGFMEILTPDHIRLRVFERGVGETLACGSGACAAVVIGRLLQILSETVNVDLPGGRLTVAWKLPAGNIFLSGPAEMVYQGELL